MTWYEHRSIEQRYVQLGKPDQNAFIERFNRSYSEEVLNAYVFADLTEVRQISWNGGMAHALQRGATHDALGSLPPALYRERVLAAKNSTSELST